MSLLFNGVAKIPLQMFILFIGAIVFSFYNFAKPPVVFDQTALHQMRSEPGLPARCAALRCRFRAAQRSRDAIGGSQSRKPRPAAAQSRSNTSKPKKSSSAARADAIDLAKKSNGGEFNDTNYIFLTFVTHYLPAGVVGLIIATIIGAAMSSVSSEINSLATVTVIDIYKRHFRKDASDHHYLRAAKVATVFWGALCGYHRGTRKKSRLADRSREHSGIAILWRAAWECLCWPPSKESRETAHFSA